MALRVAIQMDPVELANPATDTTVMMALSAQARGHRLWVYRPDRLAMEDGRVRARARPLSVRDVVGDHYTLGEPVVLDLADDVDVVLMRQDPPFDLAYITATYLLEHVAGATLVVNDPVAVRDAPEKLFVTRFPDLQPPTLVSHDPVAIKDFRARFPDMILKPLYGGGGSGVARLKPGDANLEALLELHFALNREPVICQAFLPAVEAGDKRILLVEGEPMGVVNRVPAKGQDRSNLRVGGRAEAVDLTARDREICSAVGPELKARGLIFAGLDVIGDWLTEINVTSPTGARQLQGFTGVDATDAMWAAVDARLAARPATWRS